MKDMLKLKKVKGLKAKKGGKMCGGMGLPNLKAGKASKKLKLLF